MEGAEERAHQRRTLQLIHKVAVEIELAQVSGGAYGLYNYSGRI